MYTFTVILILIVCVLLAIVVLIQNSKGGGLAANFSAPNQIMGVRRTTDFLEKATWWLAGILIALSLLATISIPRATEETNLENDIDIEMPVQSQEQPAAAPVAAPATEAPAAGTEAPAAE